MTSPITRREFAGLVAAGSLLATDVALADDKNKSDDKSKPDKAIQPDAKNKAESVDANAEFWTKLQSDLGAGKPVAADLMTALVLTQYPHANLVGEMLNEVRVDAIQYLGRSSQLSSFPLTNADEPGFVFTAWRKDPVT